MKLTNEQCENMIKEYVSGIKPIELGKKYNVDRKYIHYILKKYNIKSHGLTKLKQVNHNYFDKLDTVNKAYILGFLYADGCIIDSKLRKQKQISICIAEDDIEILEFIKKELEYKGNIYHQNPNKINCKPRFQNGKLMRRNNLVKLNITSEKLCNNLIILGCYPRKSLICKFPTLEQVPEHLMPHFIRGLMDGDGYISKIEHRKNYNPTFVFGIVGTLNICKGVRSWLSNKLILNPNQKIRNGTVYGIAYSHNKDLIKIYNYLYPNDTDFSLKRKYNKFKEIFDYNYKSKISYEELTKK